MPFELDVSWNSTGFNASIQTMISGSYPEAMSYHSSIHRVIVDTGDETPFTPKQLNASIGDTILFTPVRVGDRIAQVSPAQACQADGSLSPLNYSRLIIPYLVTTEDSAWFYRLALQQDCAPRSKDIAIFSLNSSNLHSINFSIATSVTQAISTSIPQGSDLLRTQNGQVASMLIATPTGALSINNSTFASHSSIWTISAPTINTNITMKTLQTISKNVPQAFNLLLTRDGRVASMLTTAPSTEVRPINNSKSATNSSIWMTGVPNPVARAPGISFLGRAATKEVSRSVVVLIITYHYVMGVL